MHHATAHHFGGSRRARRRMTPPGSEPVTAASDLGMRRRLSQVFGTLYLVGAVGFAYLAAAVHSGPGPDRTMYVSLAALCAAGALVALVDLIVVTRRMHRTH